MSDNENAAGTSAATSELMLSHAGGSRRPCRLLSRRLWRPNSRLASLLLLLYFFCIPCVLAETPVLFDLQVKNGKVLDASGQAAVTLEGLTTNAIVAGWTNGAQAIELSTRTGFISMHSPAIDAMVAPAFTLEAWVKPNRVYGAMHIIHKMVWWSSGGYSCGTINLEINNGIAAAGCYNGAWYGASGGQVYAGRWNHLAATLDKGEFKLFVNGSCAASNTLAITELIKCKPGAGILIGNGCWADAYRFEGAIGRVRVKAAGDTNFFLDDTMRAVLKAEAVKPYVDRESMLYEGMPCKVGLRPGSYDTILAGASTPPAVIVAPASEEGLAQGRRIAKFIQERTGLVLPVIKDTDAIKGRCQGLKDEYRRRPAILLGNIVNNEAIIPLYARYLSFADADYPGKGGYTVRTIRNPWGVYPAPDATNRVGDTIVAPNVILLEASDSAGLSNAVNAFLAAPQVTAQPGQANCKFIMEVHPVLAPSLAGSLNGAISSAAGFYAQAKTNPNTGWDMDRVYSFPMAYLLTGDKRIAEALGQYATNITREITAFPADDYTLEGYMRLLQVINSGNIVDEETVRRLDMNLFLTLAQSQSAYWLVKGAGDIGTRHQMSGTLSYNMACAELYRNLAPDTSRRIKDFICRLYAGTYAHYKYITQVSYAGCTDAGDMQTDMTSVFQFALANGETTGFENGIARTGAEKMIGTVDNLGCGVGSGTYEDAYPEGATKIGAANGAPVLMAAFYYRDPYFKWLNENQAGLGWGSWFNRNPFGLHMYATGDALPAKSPPANMITMSIKLRPVYAADYTETPGFPKERLFDKAVLRGGASAQDAYVCFQGAANGGAPGMGGVTYANDALALLRYVDKGVLWLAANCQLGNDWWRSGFQVSGVSGGAGNVFPRLDVLGASGDTHFFAATLNGVRSGEWTRWAVLRKDVGLLVADTFTAGTNGTYGFCQTFKTPVPAHIEENALIAENSGQRLAIQGAGQGDVLSLDNGIPEMDAQRCWYLRNRRNANLKTGEKATLAQILTVREIGATGKTVIREIGPETYLVTPQLRGGDDCKLQCCHSRESGNPASVLNISGLPIGSGMTGNIQAPRVTEALPYLLQDRDCRMLIGRGRSAIGAFQTDAVLYLVETNRVFLAGGTWWMLNGVSNKIGKGESVALVPGDFSALLASLAPETSPVRGRSVATERDGHLITDRLPSSRKQAAGALASIREIPRNFGLMLEPLYGYSILAPIIENTHVLNDNVVKMWDPGTAIPTNAPVTIDFHKPVALSRVEICGWSGKSSGIPGKGAGLKMNCSGSLKGVGTETFDVEVLDSRYVPDMRELYKMDVWEVFRYWVDIKPTQLRYLKIAPFLTKACELAFYGSNQVPAEIRRLKTCDLDGDGKAELLVETLNREITAIRTANERRFAKVPFLTEWKDQRLFSIKLPFEIIDFTAGDLDGDGKGEIVAACYDLRLYKFNGRGRFVKVTDPLEQHLYTINLAASKGSTKQRLAVTYYGSAQFFDDNLQSVIGPVNFGSMWESSAATMDVDGDGIDDIVSHDIEGRGHIINGRSGQFGGAGGPAGISHGIWPWGAVTNGVRPILYGGLASIYSTGPKAAGLGDETVFGAILPADLNGDGVEEVIAAMTTGKLIVADHNLKILRSILVDGVPHCLATVFGRKGKLILAGTSAGLYAFTPELQQVGFIPGDATHLAATRDFFWVVINNRLLHCVPR